MRSEIKVTVYLESSKRSLSGLEPGAYCVLIWLGVSQGERERALVSSYEGIKPIRKAPPKGPPLILTSSQRPHLQRPSRWGAGFQHVNFSRKQTASIGRTPRSPSPHLDSLCISPHRGDPSFAWDVPPRQVTLPSKSSSSEEIQHESRGKAGFPSAGRTQHKDRLLHTGGV